MRFIQESARQSGGMLRHLILKIQEAAYATSMDSMMAPMPKPLTGNPDRDFALEMSKHHQVQIFKKTEYSKLVLWEACGGHLYA